MSMDMMESIGFVWREAEMLDRHEYAEWLNLWSADGLYIIPTVRDERDDYFDTLNIVLDTKAMLEERIKRLTSGFGAASAPPARTVRSMSRFVAGNTTDSTFDLRCAMQIVEFKYENTQILAADVHYSLIRSDGGLRIARKLIRLINCDFAVPTLGYLL